MVPIDPVAEVKVDEERCYVAVNDAACELLGYSRQELLNRKIDDVSFPSGAHVPPRFEKFLEDGSMTGIFGLRRKSGEDLLVRFESRLVNGRREARWTECESCKVLPPRMG